MSRQLKQLRFHPRSSYIGMVQIFGEEAQYMFQIFREEPQVGCSPVRVTVGSSTSATYYLQIKRNIPVIIELFSSNI